MAVNARTEEFQHIEVFDKPALFTNGRIARDTVPKGWYCYDIRGSDDDPGELCYLAIRGSFSATVTSFGVKGMDVEHLLKMFPPVSARLKDVPLENKNALQLIRERDRKEGLTKIPATI